MGALEIGLIVLISVVIPIILTVFYLYKKINKITRENLDTDIAGLMQEIKKAKQETKSVSGMDSIYAPLINKDFSDVNIKQLKTKAENVLRNILNSIEEQNSDRLNSVSTLVQAKVNSILEDQIKLGLHEYFDDVQFHNTVISDYQKKPGYYSVLFQISLKYKHYILKEGKIVDGSKDHLQHDRYELSMANIQDENKLDEITRKTGVYGINCPNCLAPVKTVGQKHCEYCCTEIKTIDIMSLILIDFERK